MVKHVEQVNSEEFHAERKRGIFATDVASILGLNRFGYGPLDVAVSKLSDRQTPETISMRLGKKLEPIIAELWEEETGSELMRAPTVWHQQQKWIGAHPDFLSSINKEYQEALIVEAKAASDHRGWGQPGTDQVPQDIFCQVQWQMMATGIPKAEVAVLFGLQEFARYPIEVSIELVGHLVKICGDFWSMLQRGELPERDWSDPRTAEIIPYLYRPDPAKTIELDQEALEWVNQIETLGETERTVGEFRKTLKGRLIDRLGTAAIGLLPDGIREVRRTVSKRKSYQVKESEQISLTIAKRRKGRLVQ